MENKILNNINGKQYFIIQGKKGKPALLGSITGETYIVCGTLQDNDWISGEYYSDFEEAYKSYKKRGK